MAQKKQFVCVVLAEDGTIYVERVLGPFDTKSQATLAGFANYEKDLEENDDDEEEDDEEEDNEDANLEQDEWGRYVDPDSGEAVFQVKELS